MVAKSLRSCEIMLLRQNIPLSRDQAYAMLQQCTKHPDLECCRQVHCLMVQSGLDFTGSLGDHLVRLFSTCGSLPEANQAFNKVTHPSLYSWNAIIRAHAKLGVAEMAFHFYDRMQALGLDGDKYTLTAVLQAAAMTSSLQKGMHIHEHIIISGIPLDVVLGSILLDMYAKCERMAKAQIIFDEMPNRNVISWGTLIAGYAQQGEAFLALEIFGEMHKVNVKPERSTFLSILKACSSITASTWVRHIHEQIIESGLHLDAIVGCALITAYTKCSTLEEAQNLFDRFPERNAVSWNSMISGYACHGEGHLALESVAYMQQEGIKPEKATFLGIIKACVITSAITNGRCIHEQIIAGSLLTDIILGSALINMYIKLGNLEEAHKVLNNMPRQDVVTWGAMIAGYTHYDEGHLALKCFNRMQQEGINPDKGTFQNILKACGNIEELEYGRHIHVVIIEVRLISDVSICSSIIDMYAKCGSLDEAYTVFQNLENQSVVLWSTMIAGYAHNKEEIRALECYDRMQREGEKADKVTFLSVLKACGSIGAVEQGRHIHDQIIRNHLQIDNFIGSTLVDTYAKCGCMEEACKVFDILPNHDIVSWGAIVAGYAHLGDARMAMQYFINMQKSGVMPNGVIFIAILAAFSHSGLVDEGLISFKSMRDCHGIEPTLFHYTCMVDLVSRAGLFKEAEAYLQCTTQPNLSGLRALLSAARMHCNEDLGQRCFDEIIYVDPDCDSGYVLMYNTFSNRKDNNLELFWNKTYKKGECR